MNRTFASFALVLALGSALALPGHARADTFNLDPVHSFVVFQIGHMGISHVWGRAVGPTGSFTIDPADPTRSSIQVEVKAESIDTANTARDNHLHGPDFFDAKQFPTISFKSTAFKKTADNTYEVTGNFILHGVTKPLTVTLTRIGEGQKPAPMGYRAGYETTFTLKRSDFGMTTMLDAVGDEVKLTVSLEGSK